MSYVAMIFYGIAITVARASAYSPTLATETDTLGGDTSLDRSINIKPDELDRKRNKLRTSRVKGRDLQMGFQNQSLARAIANGLRVPLSSKQIPKQKTIPEQNLSTDPLRVKIVPANAKTRGQRQRNKIRGSSGNAKKKANKKRSNVAKKRGNLNKMKINPKKNRKANKKRQNKTNPTSNKRNSRTRVNIKNKTSNAQKKRGNGRSHSQSARNKQPRQSGSVTKQRSNNNMNQRYSSSTSSFLQNINKALGGSDTSENSYGASGKPVKYPKTSSGWGGSSQPEPIIWDGGLHTETGVSGVLMPCACYDEPTWGGSSVGGKAGKASSGWGSSSAASSKSGKQPNCLCLVSGLLPDLPTTFMPTYFPTYYPTSYPTSFPTYVPTYSGDGMYVSITLFFYKRAQ